MAAGTRRRRSTLVMMGRLRLLVAFAMGPRCALAGGDSGRALTLTPENFDRHMDSQRDQKRPCLVMFHVSWCKVCQRAFPKFATASDQVHAKGFTMDFAHVDCTDDKSLCQRFDVKGYPSIKLFVPEVDVAPRNYRGARTEEHFVKYAERMTLPPVRTNLQDSAALSEALRGELYAAFVAAVPSGQELPDGLAYVADAWMDRHLFASAKNLGALLPEGAQPPADATLASVAQGTQLWSPARKNAAEAVPAVAFYQGSLDDPDGVQAWMEKNRFPGIWALSESCFYEFTHANRSVVIVAFDPAQVSAEREAILRGTAAAMADKYLFGVLDGVAWAEELKDFNIAKADLPRVLVIEENFDAWVEDIERLRLDTLESDLKALLAGAPLLRQSRDVFSRLKFYFREGQRFAVKVRGYASTGPMEFGIVIAGCFCVMLAVMCLGWCVIWVLKMLFSMDDFDPPVPDKKKN